jgi:hypothetical protein
MLGTAPIFPTPCSSGDAWDLCFTASVQGDYAVSLTVNDPEGATGFKMAPLHVAPDRAPCIRLSDPNVMAPTLYHLSNDPLDPSAGAGGAVPQGFKIMTVDDDGDPLPAGPNGRATVSWSVAKNDEAFVPYGVSDSLTLTTPLLHVGDTARVRVDVVDRAHSLTGCDKDICATTPDCIQRFTWKIITQ